MSNVTSIDYIWSLYWYTIVTIAAAAFKGLLKICDSEIEVVQKKLYRREERKEDVMMRKEGFTIIEYLQNAFSHLYE